MVIPTRCSGGSLPMVPGAPRGAGGRKHSRQQGLMLEQWVRDSRYNLYPTKEEKQQLTHATNMTYHQVSRWFANRRRKIKVAAGLDGSAGGASGGHANYDAVVPTLSVPPSAQSPVMSHSPASTVPAASPSLPTAPPLAAPQTHNYLSPNEFQFKDSNFDFVKLQTLQTLQQLADNPDSHISKLILTQTDLGLSPKLPYLDPCILEEAKKLCSSPYLPSELKSPFQNFLSQNHHIGAPNNQPTVFESNMNNVAHSMNEQSTPNFPIIPQSAADINSNFLISDNFLKSPIEPLSNQYQIESDFSEKQIQLQKQFSDHQHQQFVQARQTFLLNQIYSDLLQNPVPQVDNLEQYYQRLPNYLIDSQMKQPSFAGDSKGCSTDQDPAMCRVRMETCGFSPTELRGGLELPEPTNSMETGGIKSDSLSIMTNTDHEDQSLVVLPRATHQINNHQSVISRLHEVPKRDLTPSPGSEKLYDSSEYVTMALKEDAASRLSSENYIQLLEEKNLGFEVDFSNPFDLSFSSSMEEKELIAVEVLVSFQQLRKTEACENLTLLKELGSGIIGRKTPEMMKVQTTTDDLDENMTQLNSNSDAAANFYGTSSTEGLQNYFNRTMDVLNNEFPSKNFAPIKQYG